MSFNLYVYAPTDSVKELSISYLGATYDVSPLGTGTPCHTDIVADTTTIIIDVTFKNGYQFSRWVRNVDGSTTYSWEMPLLYTPPSGATNVYLRVEGEKISTYYATLSFDANGGTGAPSSITRYNTGDWAVTFTIPTTIPTRTNYTFAGWQIVYYGEERIYQPNSTFIVEGDTSGITYTLYAIWEEVSNGGGVRIYTGSDWTSATPHIYTVSGWVSVTPYIYTDSGWTKTT